LLRYAEAGNAVQMRGLCCSGRVEVVSYPGEVLIAMRGLLHQAVLWVFSGGRSRTRLFLHQAQLGLLIGLFVVLLAWKGYGPSKAYLVAMALAGGFLLMFITWYVIGRFVCREEIAHRGEYSTLYRGLLLGRPKLFLMQDSLAWLYCFGAVLRGFLAGGLDLFMTVCLAGGIVVVEGAAESLVNAILPPQAKPTGPL